MRKEIFSTSIVLMLLVFFFLSFALVTYAFEVDATGIATKITDGDTISVSSVGTVRLADINAPDRDEAGFTQATNYLSSLIENKKVYLDIDDYARTDNYGRLVCVVYVQHDSARLLNVNKALLTRGYAEVGDHKNNEFNPSSWSLYVSIKTDSPFTFDRNLTWALLIIPVTCLIALYFWEERRSGKKTKND